MVNELVLCSMYLCNNTFASIAKHQYRHMQSTVVDSGLVEDFLGEMNRWSFELNEHQRLHMLVIDDCIATFLYTSNFYRNFHSN